MFSLGLSKGSFFPLKICGFKKSMKEKENITKKSANANLLGLLKPYTLWIVLLVALTVLGNGLNLLVPKIIASAIDTYAQGNFVLRNVVLEFFAVAVVIFILTLVSTDMLG